MNELLSTYSTYDYNQDKHVISATTLYKPIKKIVLPMHYPPKKRTVESHMASLIGTMIHDQLEQIMKTKFARKLIKKHFGKKAKVILEVRGSHKLTLKGLKKFTITGKNDLIINDILADYKSTKSFKSEKCNEDLPNLKIFKKEGYTTLDRMQQLIPNLYEYILQGSTLSYIHKKNKHKYNIKYFYIIHIIMDWSKASKLDSPILFMKLPLLSTKEVEKYLTEVLHEYKLAIKLKKKDLDVLTDCNKTELWMADTVWKYYASANSVRAARVFSNPNDAYAYAAGKTGIVKETIGTPRACEYCEMSDSCKQARVYTKMGLINK